MKIPWLNVTPFNYISSSSSDACPPFVCVAISFLSLSSINQSLLTYDCHHHHPLPSITPSIIIHHHHALWSSIIIHCHSSSSSITPSIIIHHHHALWSSIIIHCHHPSYHPSHHLLSSIIIHCHHPSHHLSHHPLSSIIIIIIHHHHPLSSSIIIHCHHPSPHPSPHPSHHPSSIVIIITNYILCFLLYSGQCSLCGYPVYDEETGCFALNEVFHNNCFKCQKCCKYNISEWSLIIRIILLILTQLVLTDKH